MHIDYETFCVVEDGKSARRHRCTFLLPSPDLSNSYTKDSLHKHFPPLRKGYSCRNYWVKTEEEPVDTKNGQRYNCFFSIRDEECDDFESIENYTDLRTPFTNNYSIDIVIQDDGLLVKHIQGVLSCSSDQKEVCNRIFLSECLKGYVFEDQQKVSWKGCSANSTQIDDKTFSYQFAYYLDPSIVPIFNEH